MAKITVSQQDLDVLQGKDLCSLDDYLAALAEDIEEALAAERIESMMTLPGPDGEPNVEVPQEGWLD